MIKLEDDIDDDESFEAFEASTKSSSSGSVSNKCRKEDISDTTPKQQGGRWCWMLPEDGIETHYRHLDFIPDGSEDYNYSNWENSPSFFVPSNEETNEDNNNHEFFDIVTEHYNHITNDVNNTIDTITTIGNRTVNDDESPAASTDASKDKISSTATRNDRERNSIPDTNRDDSCASFSVPSNDDFEGGETKHRDSAEMNVDHELSDINTQDYAVPSDSNADEEDDYNRANHRTILGQTVHDNRWMKMYQRLKQYAMKYKNARVPFRYKADMQLGVWVQTQRKNCKAKDRIDLLNDIGFEWRVKEGNMYQCLLTYMKEHGTTDVPRSYGSDPKLALWIRKQRPQDIEWAFMYQRLLTHKKKHGTTQVPQGYKADPQLGHWVHNQRHRCQKKNRIDLLDDIGFVFH